MQMSHIHICILSEPEFYEAWVITQNYHIYIWACIDLNCEYTYHGFMMSQRLNILQMLILAEEKDILIHKIQQSCAFWFHKFKVKHIYPLLYKYIALFWEGVILLTYIITSSLYIHSIHVHISWNELSH